VSVPYRIEIDPHVLQERLARLKIVINDLRPAWGPIVEDFKDRQRELFASEGAEVGGWKPLAPRYAERKARRYPGRILVRTGRLRAASTGESGELQVVSQPSLLLVRILPKYAWLVAHRTGKREIAPVNAARVRAWTAIIDRHLQRAADQRVSA